MEDDKLKQLFSDFEPELSSDIQFMSELRRNLISVEIIKQHSAEVRARNRKAVAIAALTGFIIGFLFSLSLPYLNEAVSDWQSVIPNGSMLNIVANYFYIIGWTVIGGTSVLAALNAYEVSLLLLKPKRTTAH